MAGPLFRVEHRGRIHSVIEVNTFERQGLGTNAEKADCVSGTHETLSFDILRQGAQLTEATRTKGGGTPASGGWKIGQVVPRPAARYRARRPRSPSRLHDP